MLEAYLRDIEHELARTLSREDVQARLVEIRGHLDEGVQARLELGMSPNEAEREAIAAFGSVRGLGREIRRRERVDPRFVRACFAVVLVWCVLGELSNVPDDVAVLVPFALLIAHANYLWASARARRPQFRTLGVVSFAFWIVETVRIASRQSRWSPEPWWPELPQTALGLLRTDVPNFLAVYALLHGLGWWVGRALRRHRRPRSGTIA